MREKEIRGWTGQLVRSLGDPRPPADVAELERLYQARDYSGMLCAVKG